MQNTLESLHQKIIITIMTNSNKPIPFSTHLISGFTSALAGWTFLKIFKIYTSSVAEQFTPERLKMEAMIWIPAIFLFAVFSRWREKRK